MGIINKSVGDNVKPQYYMTPEGLMRHTWFPEMVVVGLGEVKDPRYALPFIAPLLGVYE